jgi:hypothetical protein
MRLEQALAINNVVANRKLGKPWKRVIADAELFVIGQGFSVHTAETVVAEAHELFTGDADPALPRNGGRGVAPDLPPDNDG